TFIEGVEIMKKHFFPLLIIVLSVIVWLIAFPHLPSQIATHWDFSGNVNGYSTKVGAMLTMVGLLIFLYIMFLFLPKVDPKKENYKYFTRSYRIIINSLLFIFFILNLLIIFYSLGYPIPMSSLGSFIVGAIFIILGNFLQTVRTNFFIGIRTPWTLSNDTVWRKTHRFGGKIMFIAGIIMMLSTFIPAGWREAIVIISIIVSVVLPIYYSYRVFKQENR
ncbi:SdpI family protein, partial [Heyndrickxia sporothermodurans]